MNILPAYVTDALRTPIGRINGSLCQLELPDLLAPLISALLQRNGIAAAEVDEVVVGNAAGPGGNPARVALLQAGLPHSVSGVTVDRQCGSGLEAINYAIRLVQTGAASIVIAGGAESASTAPLRARKHSDSPAVSAASTDGLPEIEGWTFYQRARFTPVSMNDPDMGVAAENVASRYGVSRQRQDQYALASHQKAAKAEQQGRFLAERLAMADAATDECIRADCTLHKLSTLPPVFLDNGTVTAGNACPINDGASLVLVQRERGSRGALKFLHAQAVGVDPAYLGMGPVASTQRCLAELGLKMTDINQVEFNEAFAAQVLACADLLEISDNQINPAGGALALGHPYGASGAILVTRLLHDLSDGQIGLATLGIGGGMGLSSVFQRV